MATINYVDKEALNVNPNILDKNKVNASDMNLIKVVGNQILTTMGVYTDDWNSATTYAIGEIAIYDNRIFKNLTGNNTATTPDQDTTNWEETTISSMAAGAASGDTLPIGSIVPYGTTTAPTNWLVCDGSAVSRTTYANLFAVIGTSFGSGDGSTTFNLPDFRTRVPVGYKSSDSDFNAIGKTGGSKELQAHDHATPHFVVGSNAPGYGGWEQNIGSGASNAYLASARTETTGTGNAGNLQPYQTVNYIIKANQSAGLVANVSNTYSTSQSDTYSCDFINDCNTYSTSETFTGKYWWDNKPIYRKVIYMAEPTSYENIATSINSANVIWYDGTVSTGGGYINKINSTEWDDNYRITGDIDPVGYFRFRAGSSQTQLANLNVIIEYTKNS